MQDNNSLYKKEESELATSTNTKKQQKNEKRKKIQEIKERLAMNPYSIAILPHTEEGHALSYMVFHTDRLMWTLRKKTGVTVNPQKLVDYSNELQRLLKIIYSITGDSSLNNNNEIISEDKYMIAKMKNSWIMLPRTPEGRMLAYSIKKIDPLIMQIKAIEDTKILLNKIQSILNIIVEFNQILCNISQELSLMSSNIEKRYTIYKEPTLVKKIAKNELVEQCSNIFR